MTPGVSDNFAKTTINVSQSRLICRIVTHRPLCVESRRTDRGRACLAVLAADAAHQALERQPQRARRKPPGKLAQRLER